MIDGLDGLGKGVILDSIKEYLENKNLRVFDIHNFWEEHHFHPDFENPVLTDGRKNKTYIDPNSFDVLLSSEPTFVSVGRTIRDEVITKNNRNYSADFTAQMFSADRHVFYKRVILPLLQRNKIIIQSRGVITSLVYQSMQSKDEGSNLTQDYLKSLIGNNFTLHHAPDLIIIPTIKSVEELMQRLEGREKKDDAIFETLDFQNKVKPHYESEELKKFFESLGTKIKYLDAGISVESTREQAKNIIKEFM